ncbi:MAG: 4-hydroxyproline epimerase [Pseudomonadota bacterium]|nr:4-hydroxyproline epimerase [Pseudomonadota bacterium]
MTETTSGRSGTFFCIDGHTCGNPVRMVVGGAPVPEGSTMSERRVAFIRDFDWIRTGLMFEPRGHDIMSGSILMPSTRSDCDTGVLYIEVSGCLPMCGHGTIGTVTFAIERQVVRPREPGRLRLDTPAGVVIAAYEQDNGRVDRVRITNVVSFLAAIGLPVELPGLGALRVDVAYGGNFYAIIEPQAAYGDLSDLRPDEIRRLSPMVRRQVNALRDFAHPENPAIRGVSHVMWTGRPTVDGAHARNAVFYGDAAIDRSPCGTGTSARMAQLQARGDLAVGDDFVHESIIGSLFHGRVEAAASAGSTPGIVPSIAGWARMTGINTIFIDEQDPFAHGFQLV